MQLKQIFSIFDYVRLYLGMSVSVNFILVPLLQKWIEGKLLHPILSCLLNLMTVFPMCLNSPSHPNDQKQTKHSATSSSIPSARLKITTERAAIQARLSALKQKHAVEMEKKDYKLI